MKKITKQNLPLYKLSLDLSDPLNTGLNAIAFVADPAIEIGFQMFTKSEIIKLSATETKEGRRIVSGPVLIPGKKIFRVDPDGSQYDVIFDQQDVEKIVQRFFQTNSEQNINLEHSLKIDGAILFESFISDRSRGISAPDQYRALPEKTWFCSYYVTDDVLWQSILDGTFTGFSLEGFFQMFPIKMAKQKTDLDLFNEIKTIIDSLDI